MLGLQGEGFVLTLFQLKNPPEPPGSVTKIHLPSFQPVLNFAQFAPI